MSGKAVLSAVTLSVALIVTLTAVGLPPGHSAAFNVAWSTQYGDAISWSEPLPRFLPGLWAGFGGMDFFYYAPLPFWVGGAIVGPICGACSPTITLVIASSLFLVGSGWSMWAFLRVYFDRYAAAAGAAAYVVLPYHFLIDWFERQAVGEFAAFVFLPLIALGVERIRRRQGGGGTLSIGVAGVCLSHLPSALLAGHVFAISAFVVIWRTSSDGLQRLRLLAVLAVYVLLGLALSSFYWLPAIALLDTVSPQLLYSEYFEAWRWLYGPHAAQPSIRWPSVILTCFLCAVPIILAALTHVRNSGLVWLIVPTVIAILMNLSITEIIWREWVISRAQFPWRMMMFVDFSTAFAVAALVAGATSRWKITMLVVALGLSAAPYARVASGITYSGDTAPLIQRYAEAGAVEYLSPEMAEIVTRRLEKDSISFWDLNAIVRSVAGMADEFDDAETGVDVYFRGARMLSVVPEADADSIVLPVQYWAFWQAETQDGAALEIVPNARFGTLEIMAPRGGFAGEPIIVRLPIHWSERIGWIASGLAALLLVIGCMRRAPGLARDVSRSG